ELLILQGPPALTFPLPLFSEATGNGSNAVFEIVGFVSVRVLDFKTNGSQADRSLTLEFVASVIEGGCCDPAGIDTGTRVVQICAVKSTDASSCLVN
ncbi:MAG: hypothetical protein ACR2PK_16445, partial [Acidimicrobiales bacterium]